MIPLARGWDQIVRRGAAEEQEMVVNRQFRFNAGKDLTGLLRSGMIAADSFQLRGTLGGGAANGSYFVNHQIGAVRMINQILIESRVSRQYGGTSSIIDAIPEGGQLFTAMIDLERAYRHAVVRINNSLFNLLGFEFGACDRIAPAAHAQIHRER